MDERNLHLRHRLALHSLRAGLVLGSHIPISLLGPLGELFGRLALRLSVRYRQTAEQQLAAVFPEQSEAERALLLSAMAAHLGRVLAEASWLWRARAEEIVRICSLSGIEHLQAARSNGRGAVLVTAHCGNWELLNARLGVAGIPLTIAVRNVNNPSVDTTITRLRSRFGAEVVARDGHTAGRRLAHALQRNRVNGLLIDQDILDVPGVFVPFFGRPAWTPSGAATLALRFGCPMIPAFTYRRPDKTHHIEVQAPLAPPSSGSVEEDTRLLTAGATAAIEAHIRTHPAQWVWLHKRWKTNETAS